MRQGLSLLLIVAGLASLVGSEDEPQAAVIPGESRPTATRLEEAGKRLAEKKPAEAIALLQSVIESSGNDLVALKGGRSIRARHLAHAALSRLDASGLALYRRKVDPQATRWLEESVKANNPGLLRRVVDEAFCSKGAPTALVRLGDLAFERGRFDEAEGWWQLLVPLEPPDKADIGPDTLLFPDPPEELAARTRAKQLLARLFRGQHDWKADLDAFRKRHPKASGALAGREGIYADTLESIAAVRAKTLTPLAGDWTTFGGSPSRGRLTPAPPRLLDHLSQLCRPGFTWRFDLQQRHRQRDTFPAPEQGKEADAARRLAFYPVVVGHHAFVADARYITAYDLRTGTATTCYDAIKYVGGIDPDLELPTPFADLRYTLTAAEGCLFARLGAQAVKDIRPPLRGRKPAAKDEESILVCLGLNLGGNGALVRRRWMVRGIDTTRKEYAVFEGAPLVSDGRVYIAATRFEGDRVVTAIHCYPAHPEDTAPAALWRTDVCETRELLSGPPKPAEILKHQRNRHHLLTLAGSRVVYCSHSGAIVGLDARTGSRSWAVKYPRRDTREPEDNLTLRDLAPCLFSEGRLYAAPSDSDHLLCLDPVTGSTLWQRERLDAVHLLGVGQGRLIFTTWRNPRQGKLFAGGLRAVMAEDGSDTGGWSLPDDGGGLVPFGRGLLIGDLVLWPTPVPLVVAKSGGAKTFGVFAVRQKDGQQPDNPTLLHRIPSGNLVYANGCLLVADRQTLYAFVPPEMLPDEEDDKKEEAVSPRKALRRARAAAARGKTERAEEQYTLAMKGAGRRLRAEARWELQDLYLAAAKKALAEKDEKNVRVWLGKATPKMPARDRLFGLLRGAPVWEGLPLPLPAWRSPPTIWDELVEEASIHDLIVEDEQGLPQRVGHLVTERNLGWRIRAKRLAELLTEDLPKLTGKSARPFFLPLLSTCEVKLSPGETFLPVHWAEGPVGDRIWSGQGRALVCRALKSGEVKWKKSFPFDPAWLGALGTVVVVGGREGMAAVHVGDGERLWTFAAPPLGRDPGTLGGEVRVVRDVLPPQPLADFQLAGGRLFAIQGERRLLALDALTGKVVWQRWAPGAAFGMPAPRGRFLVLCPVGADNLLVQASARLMLLDAATGKVRREAPCPLECWPRSPLLLGDGKVCVVPDSRRVIFLDASKAKVVWTYILPGKTTRSGEPPLVVGNSDALFVVIPENIGYRLQRLKVSIGYPVWQRPLLLSLTKLDPRAWLVGSKALYHADGGKLTARSLEDGAILWQRSLAPGKERVGRVGDSLLVWSDRGETLRIGLRWLLGSVQWRVGTWSEARSSVEILDASTGALVQRINVEDAFPRSRSLSWETGRAAVFPSPLVRREPNESSGMTLWWDSKGLLACLGNKVKALSSLPPEK
jgi:outer membrane protein assembly factor BamB